MVYQHSSIQSNLPGRKLKIQATSRLAFFAVAFLILACALLVNSGLALQHMMLELSGISYEQRRLVEQVGKKKFFLLNNLNQSDVADHTVEDVRNDILAINKQIMSNQEQLRVLLENNRSTVFLLLPQLGGDEIRQRLTNVGTYLEQFDKNLVHIKRATIPALRAVYNFGQPVDTLFMEDGLLLEAIEALNDALYRTSLQHNRLLYLLYGSLLVLVLIILWLIWFFTLRPLSIHLERNYDEIQKKNASLAFQARHDVLTGLLNRDTFLRTMNDLVTQKQVFNSLALVLIDVDNFKVINDNYGHDTGDSILLEFSQILQAGTLANETLYRLAGDEFALVISNVNNRAILARRIEEIFVNLQHKVNLLDRDIPLQASFGIAWGKRCGSTLEEIFSAADMALYHVKCHGRNSYAFYEDIDSADISQVIKIEQELHRAVINHEFSISYQPIVDLKTDQIVHLEVLLRWRHPQQGSLLPQYWMPIAERLSLLSTINMQVFDCLENDAQKWLAADQKPLSVYVNITDGLLLSGMVLERVAELHQKTRGLIKVGIEVTESVILDRSFDLSIKQLKRLSSHGIDIALDDFGTGFANLSHLNSIPYDVIKVDHGFVSKLLDDPQTYSIIESLVGLAKKLGKTVVCEGIESSQARDVLRKLGCDYGQGYFYSPPLEFDDLNRLLIRQGESIHAVD